MTSLKKNLISTIYRYQFISDRKTQIRRKSICFKAKVRVYSGPATWYFAILPLNVSKAIRKSYGHLARGFGSLPVNATAGKSSWKTSIFPDKKAGVYLLPLKSEIRKKENIRKSASVYFSLQIL